MSPDAGAARKVRKKSVVRAGSSDFEMLVELPVAERARVRLPVTAAERKAVEYVKAIAPGTERLLDTSGLPPVKVRALARALSAVRLPALGITDRHLRVDVGRWRAEGEPVPEREQLRVRVIEGPRPTRTKRR